MKHAHPPGLWTQIASHIGSQGIIAAELSIGVACIAAALVGETLLFSRADQLKQLDESLEKDEAVKPLARLRRLLVQLLSVATSQCAACIYTLSFPSVPADIITWISTIAILGTSFEVGRRLAKMI